MSNSYTINQIRQILQQMEQAESRNAQLLQELQQAEQHATQQTRQLQQLVAQIDANLTSSQSVTPFYGYQGSQVPTQGAAFSPQVSTSFFGSYSQPKSFGQQSQSQYGQMGQENFGYGGPQF
ncbi:MAG TPA: hypothetical protein GX008_09235 [Firmicutes bacterium]|jgi:DNA-binding transcriptional MerR regulator|nr:MAG: hypothetical protein AA931_04075 [Peptococcaceae bacterium 1109]HHT73881.1 hypothetical protein [Bacillota bacterium]